MTPDLSPKQRACVELVAQGMTDKEIAARLGMSPRTVTAHLGEAYARLGVSNRREAVRALRIAYAPSPLTIGASPDAPSAVPASGGETRSDHGSWRGLFATLPPPPGRVMRLLLILLVAVVVATVVAGIVMMVGTFIERVGPMAPENGL